MTERAQAAAKARDARHKKVDPDICGPRLGRKPRPERRYFVESRTKYSWHTRGHVTRIGRHWLAWRQYGEGHATLEQATQALITSKSQYRYGDKRPVQFRIVVLAEEPRHADR